MADPVQHAVEALRQELGELRAELRARDERIAEKDRQIAALMEVITRVAEGKAAAAPPVQLGLPGVPPGITCNAIWERYFPTIEDQTWAKDRRSTMKAPLAHFGEMEAANLKRADWTHYRDNIRKKQKTPSGNTPSVGTRNLELVCFKVMLNWAVDQELLPANPLARVKKERARPSRETVIGDQDLEALLSKSGPLLRAFVLIGIDSGMRKTEVRTLRWDRIEKGGRIRISWTVAKTKRSRSVRLSQRALDALKELPRALSPYVFANPNTGQPFSDSHMWYLFRDACVEAKVSAADGDGNVHYHDARHSYITRSIQNGNPIPVVMRAAGHITLRQASRYMHIDETDLEIMKAKNDQAIAAGPRRDPQRAHFASDDLAMRNGGK